MNGIAGIDIFSFSLLFLGFVFLFFRPTGPTRDIRVLLGLLIVVTLAYFFFMILEWLNITHELESVENLVGASVPMMWAFFIYSIIQNGITKDLAINRENLRITLNSIGDAVIATDVKGRITQLNPAAESLLGIELADYQGKRTDELFTFIETSSRKRITNPIEKVLESGKMFKLGLNTVLQTKANKEFYISDSAAPIYNDHNEICGVVLVFSDMTERFRQEEKIRQHEERFKLAIGASKAGLWDWFLDTGKVVYDERWAEIIGYTLNELEPLTMDTWRKRVHPGDLINLEELIEAHARGTINFIEHESRLKHKNGEWIWVIARGRIVQRDKQNNPLRMTGTLIDISRQKKNEDDLKAQIEQNRMLNQEYAQKNKELIESIDHIRKINAELVEARMNAEESYKLKSAFLANMSHEIRTPMNGIIGFSELLNDIKIPEDKRIYYAGIVIDSSKQLLNIVNDILDFSRMETGKISLSFEEVVVNEMINILYAFFEPQAKAKSLKLIAHKPLINDKSIIITDKTRLRQILTNLLNNAIKFTDEGTVEFGYKKSKTEIEFFVKDTGIGIPPELHEKIFEPFRQAELEISNQYGGTGLGLSISRKLTEYLNGNIWLDSKPGEGSSFHFTLPLKPDKSGDTQIRSEKKLPNKKMYNMLVLVVEDDDVNYLFLETILSKSQIKTIRAGNGLEAVELCRQNPDINLVLMDIKLPFLNGYDATRQIKEFRPQLPVIAQTAYAMHEDRKKAMDAGCDGYISKPIIATELFNLIDTFGKKK
jgi:PAS domain S-box-containing protein